MFFWKCYFVDFFIIMLVRIVLYGYFSYNNIVRRFYFLFILLLFLIIFCFFINWGNILDIKIVVFVLIVIVKV